jgi:hypothetical protein
MPDFLRRDTNGEGRSFKAEKKLEDLRRAKAKGKR